MLRYVLDLLNLYVQIFHFYITKRGESFHLSLDHMLVMALVIRYGN